LLWFWWRRHSKPPSSPLRHGLFRPGELPSAPPWHVCHLPMSRFLRAVLLRCAFSSRFMASSARPAGMAPSEADRILIGCAPEGYDFRRPSRFIAASGSRLRFSAPARRLPLALAGWEIRSLVIISGRSQAGDRVGSRRIGGSRRSAAPCGPAQGSRLVACPRHGSNPAIGEALPLWSRSAAPGRPRERWRASVRRHRS
jgi:hypothetical protein